VQSFNGVVRPAGEARPGWKVLRVLGNLLDLPGFDQDSADAVRAQALPADVAARLDNRVSGAIGPIAAPAQAGALERLPEVAIYSVDPIVRRAPSLQQTRDARAPKARVSPATLAALGGPASGDKVRVSMAGGGDALVELAVDPALADGVLRLASGHEATVRLAAMTGAARVERA